MQRQEEKIKKESGQILSGKLHTPLTARGDEDLASKFLKGGFKQDGYGIPEKSCIDGSFAIDKEGDQGYYVSGGKEVFLGTVEKMKGFFRKRAERLGKPIRYIIKPGIGGQHTPFQGIASVFEIDGQGNCKISGEYELGKDYGAKIQEILNELRADWSQIAVIPSSKSGSTDETMLIFQDILYVLLKKISFSDDERGDRFAKIVFNALHRINFIDGKEKASRDLFKVEKERFGTSSILSIIYEEAMREDLVMMPDEIERIFKIVIGNMFFETTDRPGQSRLSAFIRNSGLDKQLGEDAPGFGAMFDNVGGRWTADLHMMTFLAYYDLDASAYWQTRFDGIMKVRAGTHTGCELGDLIVDNDISDIALVVPDEFFWFGKAIEQNFNESIWQDGFANLIAIKQDDWDKQKRYYEKLPCKLVINLSGLHIPADAFFVFDEFPWNIAELKGYSKAKLSLLFAELFTNFYAVTHTAGNRLIIKALRREGFKAEDVDVNDPENPATKIMQQNLYLRQPYVELGKNLLTRRLTSLQEAQEMDHRSIKNVLNSLKVSARDMAIKTNVPGIHVPNNVSDEKALTSAMKAIAGFAKSKNRKLVPFIYLEDEKFYELREYLINTGIEWVLQGTGDQHINYQQVLAQPWRFLPIIISCIPEGPLPGHPAIGFAKNYLHNISPHIARHFFAEASYDALTDLRQSKGGLGVLLIMPDSERRLELIKSALTGLYE